MADEINPTQSMNSGTAVNTSTQEPSQHPAPPAAKVEKKKQNRPAPQDKGKGQLFDEYV